MCFCKTNIHIHNFINYNDWLPVTAVRKSNSGERVTSVFQQRLIKSLLKCLSVNSAVHFNYISKDNRSNYKITYRDVLKSYLSGSKKYSANCIKYKFKLYLNC